ncbi:MAG TPA: GNAT family N-acetyltransferase [Methanobacteriaceae archaeon]|nr:GNAT family N-acetyltransferase [Methanobacteriaceae archaeon]
MSIKTAVKEHFEHSLAEHWAYFFPDGGVDEVTKSIYTDNRIDIRRFTLEDLDECVDLFKKVFSADPWYDKWISKDQTRNYLNELIENPVFEGFVACEDSDIVAVCFGHRRSWWMGKSFFVDEFFVENKRQGNGIGTKLLDCVVNSLAEEKYTCLTLLTNKNIPAETFYLKNGFYNNLQRTVMVKKL